MEGRPPSRAERAASAVDPDDELARAQAAHDAQNALAEVRQGLVVRPGDMLVLTVRPDLSMEAVEEMVSRLRVSLPGVRCVLVTADGIAVIPGGDDGSAGTG